MGMKAMMQLKEMLCDELEELTKKGELSAGSLDVAHKLTDTIKNIDKIMMLEDDEDGYSERGGYSGEGGGYSQARGGRGGGRGGYSRERGGYSQGGDWEARGRFGGGHSYDEGGSSYANRGKHYVRGHYSREDGKEHMMRTFGELMNSADPEQRRIIQRAMDELRTA